MNTPWPHLSPFHVRTASVNSFGFGGANAHAILEAANSNVCLGGPYSESAMAITKSTLLLPFSAGNSSSLESRVADLEDLCHRGVNIADLAHSLDIGRSRFGTRGFILASQRSLDTDIQIQNLRTSPSYGSPSAQPLTFVFTGQGAQWPQMGQGLIEHHTNFRHTIQELDSILHSIANPPSWTIQGEIRFL